MNTTTLNTLQTLKFGRYVEVTLKNGKTLCGEYRGITQMLDKDGHHQLTADVMNIAKFVADPNMPAADKEQMFGVRVTNIKDIKTSKRTDDLQKDVQLQRAMIATNKALSKIDWNAVDATVTNNWNEVKNNKQNETPSGVQALRAC